MSNLTKPTLSEAAKRNPCVAPEKVRQMQLVVKQLEDRGVLQPSKYGIEAPLSGPKASLAPTRVIRAFNRSFVLGE
jgi:hypothetical protein